MSRIVWPYIFTLRAGNLIASSKNPNFVPVRNKYFQGSNGNTAIALRWSTRSELGFPRQPFQIYRRLRNSMEGVAVVVVQSTQTTITGVAQAFPVLPGNDTAYVVIVQVAVGTSSSVTVQALDAYGKAMPSQVVTLSQSGSVEFRCPGIAAIAATGAGAIGPIEAIGETVYANLPDWVHVQTVGLPLLNNEIGTFYKTTPQGFWPNPLTPPSLNGVTAATERTFITAELEQPPPPTGIADLPLPAWPQPNASAYVNSIRGTGNIVPMIEQCLVNSVDTDPQLMQSLYAETITTDGLSQIGATLGSPTGPPSQVQLPVTGVVMLAVSTDPYAAVGLGYGTLDIPPLRGVSTITVAIAPASANVAINMTSQFTATVTGATNNTLVWSVNGVVGGNSIVGTITVAGLYTAPAAIPSPASVTVNAVSAQNPSAFGTAFVTVTGKIIGIPTHVPAPALTTAEVGQPQPAPIAVAVQPFSSAAPPVLPPADNYGLYDYMVTAPYVLPIGFSGTLAALSTGQLPVSAPAGLASVLSQSAAPLERDQPIPAAIRVGWTASADPQGYGILASRAPNQSQVLNATRPAAVGGFDVFVGLSPVNPAPNTPPALQGPSFTDVTCSLPLAAPPVNNRYLVAAQDIFGQWSNWVESDTALSPAPVTKPSLRNADFLFTANSGSPPSPVVPATLRIDFGWDWQDRAPAQIRFTGQFVPAPANTLNPPFLGGFATSNSGPVGAPVILTFSYSGANPDTVPPTQVIPTVTSGHSTNGPVVVLGSGTPPTPDPSSNQVQYRMELTGIQLDFSQSNEIDFVIYATATEVVQPGVWSDPTDQSTSNAPASPPPPPLFIGKIVRAMNPNPPTVTFTPPPISWTALPDATGMARGVLSWQPDPAATGYYVWEATESALLHHLPPGSPGGTPDPAPGTPAPTRATTLKNLLDTYQDASLQGFARLNKDPIAASSTEIILPSAADTLYVFRISAISPNNVESGRSSSVAIFGVPRRNIPATPRVLLRSGNGSPSGIQVIVLPVASSALPAGYRLFRVRNKALAQSGSAMGPAKYDENSPIWQIYSGQTLAGTPLSGMALLDTAAIPSWYPYYYRATAVGADDPANGLYSGESPFSLIQSGYALPKSPPLIESFQASILTAMHFALVTLTTDLPAAAASPVGTALVELLLLSPGSPPGPLQQHQLFAEAPELLPVGTITPPPAPPTVTRITRTASDENGHWKLSILLPYSDANAGNYIVRLTDPLARQSTASF